MSRIVPSYIAGLMLGVLALVFCIGAFKLGFWSEDGPGPGLLPLAAGALLLPMIVVALREPVPADETPFKVGSILAIGGILIYAVVLPRIGFAAATLAMLALWVRFFYGQSWLRAAICSAGLTALGFFIFHVLLQVPMPLFPEW